MRLVVVYRGVFLYGESGAGKSSLVNAGLIPAVAAEGFRPDRLRVQPRAGEELVVERIELTEAAGRYLPSSFGGDGDGASQIVLPVDTLRAQLEVLPSDGEGQRPLLIFDQFEELITLFEEAPEDEALEEALDCQRRIVDVLVELLRDETLGVKLLFSFREDYLAKVKKLLHRCPELVSQSLRLSPPSTEALVRIIRGPFEEHPGRFERELSPELSKHLSTAIERRSVSGAISLSELQIVSLRLWESNAPEALLEEKGVQGILEDYLEDSLNRFPEELHYPAVALLSQMVTGSGARNVISADDLIERVRAEERDIPADRLERTLDALERETKLVRRERRRDLDLYEISSEFLVPWIGRQREERLKARERAELERQLEIRRLRQQATYKRAVVATVLLLLSVAFGVLTLYFLLEARGERDRSRSRVAAQEAIRLLGTDPAGAITGAFRAWKIAKTDEAEEALRSALVASRRRAVLRGQTGPLLGGSFSPDGARVVTAGVGRRTRIWDAVTGKPVASFGEPGETTYSAMFSPDGRSVVTAGADGLIRVWDAETRRLAFSLGKPGSPLYSAMYNADGTRLVAAGADGTARIWDLATRNAIELRGHAGPLYGASFSPDGTRVVTAGADATARVWSVKAKKAFALRGDSDQVFGASFSPDGTRIVTASANGAARVWDVKTRKSFVLRGDRTGIYSAVFSPDGARIVTASADRKAWVWDVETRRAFVLSGHTAALNSAVFSRDGTRILTESTDGTARIWDTRAVGSAVVVSQKGPLRAAAFSSDGRFIATVRTDGTAQLWSGASRWTARALLGQIVSASFSPDSRRLLTASKDGTAGIWDVGSGQPIRTFARRTALNRASFDPGGKRIVVAGDGATVLDGETGRVRATIIQPGSGKRVVSARFSADGKRVVTVSDVAKISDPQTGEEFSTLSKRNPVDAAFGPTGLLVTAYDDGTATIWNVEDPESPRAVALLHGHAKRINSAGFSPDGKFVVTASDDGTARVWEAGSGRLLAVLAGHRGPLEVAVLSDHFKPDGKLAVLTAGADGIVRIYPCDACLPIDELIRLGTWKEEEQAGKTDSSAVAER